MIETPATAEELLRKIQKLEKDHDHLKELMISDENDKPESQYVNILESMGQSVHMLDLNERIIYWNQMAQNLYGYTAEEVLGKTAADIIIGATYSELGTQIIQRAVKGVSWSGQFPVRNKYWEQFTVIATLTPCRDENGITFAVTCICADARPFQEPRPQPCVRISSPYKTDIASKISNLVSRVKLKMKTRESNMDHDSQFSPASLIRHKFTTDSNEGSENRPTSASPWSLNDQEQESGSAGSYSCGTSSSWSINGDFNKDSDIHFENMDVEIPWDDLVIREQIGQRVSGAGAKVYHALLYGSDVAVKIFNNNQEYPNDAILSFRKEVCLMKRLRYPNILLFMGAIVSPQHLCIVTEFLSGGSLFKLLQCSTTKLDWRRRVRMAMDIAWGMNYLHRCQPPIIHRNLKSSNILVNKNWSLKVGDFGLSRIKHETYLATNTTIGMPQWMAPEVLRSEQVDEKSDVYSYGVVLWEITTRKIPWENLNSMQVIGAVGFMNQRLKIPDDVDPKWASLIESCWSREPQSRPTFQEILVELKDLQKMFMVQH